MTVPVAPFTFTPDGEAQITRLLSRYPSTQAAVLPVLWVAQRQVLANGTRQRALTPDVIRAVAKACNLTPAYVWGVATFYTMYHTRPVGEHLLEICTSVACCLMGGEELYQHICKRLEIDPAQGGTTPDGKFTVRRAECLAACGYAPMLQLDEGPFLEHLTLEQADELLSRWGQRIEREQAARHAGPGVVVQEGPVS